MKRRMRLAMLVGALLLLVSVGSMGCAGTRPAGLVDGALHDCPWTPNCACTQEEGGPAPLAFEGDPAAAQARLVAFLEADENVTVERIDGWYVYAVFATPTMGFKDDVEFLVEPDRHVIHVRSASRLGLWDLGTNARRIEHIRASW